MPSAGPPNFNQGRSGLLPIRSMHPANRNSAPATLHVPNLTLCALLLAACLGSRLPFSILVCPTVFPLDSGFVLPSRFDATRLSSRGGGEVGGEGQQDLQIAHSFGVSMQLLPPDPPLYLS